MGQDELGDTLPASDAPVGAAADSQARGATIGRYVVLGTLGSGGMGIVYAAFDPELDRRIALKLLRGRATDDTGRARIRREAQALARTNHPNIVTVYDVGDHGDGVFIAMELVDGGTLREWQARHRWRDVLAAYVAAGRGLAAAHASGLVHRDFKPENVLVSTDGRVRVTDFGLARLADATVTDRPDVAPTSSAPPVDSVLTVEGAVMGTIGYMSPEQCDGAAVDARSDQFAWCVATWEALYGKRPFRGTTLVEIAGAMAGPPPELPDAPGIPRAIGHALLRGLAADPAARWPTMEPLLAACAPPRRRAGRVLAIAGGLALVGGAVAIALAAGSHPAAAEACETGARRVAGIWDGPRRTALASHFATSTRTDVAAALGLATRDFDTYASTWSAQWDAACSSTDRARDPLLYAQRINCLERTLVDLQGLVDAYLAVDPERFALSWRGNAFAIWQTPLADCARVPSIRATPPAPLPGVRDEITRLVVEMHRARVEARTILNINTGDSIDPVLARLDAIAARLDALEAPAAAEAAWWRATYSVRDPEGVAIDRALALARKYHNDRWLAFGYATQVTAALDKQHDPARARALLAQMDEAYERSGGDPHHLELHATVDVAEGQYARALDEIQAARPGDALDHFGPDALSVVEMRILITMGRMEEAVAEAHRHVARAEAVWRGDQWIVADAHEVLAHVLLYAHDPAGALAELHTTLAMHARIGSPPQRTQSAQFLLLACATLLGLDAERDAMATTLGADNADLPVDALDLVGWAPALVPWSLAHGKPGPALDTAASAAAYRVGDVATAERLATRAPVSAATIEEASGRFIVAAQVETRKGHPVAARLAALAHFRTSPKPEERDAGVELEARVLAARGSWAEVRALVEPAALATLRVGTTERARLDAILGRALVETHEPARAIPFLERCLFQSVQVLFSWKNANELVADASFDLARALWDSGGDRTRARALAAQAIAGYTSFQVAPRTVAETWLAAHP